MKVELEKSFPLAADKAVAWALLQDLPAVAACMPGAEITEVIDDKRFKGMVKVKLGPAAMSFKGDIEIKELDAEKTRLRLVGRGQDSKGASSVQMDLSAWVADQDGDGCALHGQSVVSVTGKAASLGGRMMGQISGQILKQFGDNFANRALAMGEGEAAQTAQKALSERPAELNGIALAWNILLDFFRGLFGRGKSGA